MTKDELEHLRDTLLPLLMVGDASNVGAAAGGAAGADEVLGSTVGESAGAGGVLGGPVGNVVSGGVSDQARRYLQFYGIDFAGAYPDLSHRLGTVNSGDYLLAVHHWSRPGSRRLMLLVHGYFDHVGLYEHLIRFALDRGYNVAAFDLPGHGLSTGRPAAIDDFRHYSRAIEDVLQAMPTGTGLDVIAQSTGCSAVMDLLQREPQRIDGAVVLLAPLVRPRGWRSIRAAHSLLGKLVGVVPRTFPKNSNDANFLRFLRADPLQSKWTSVRWVGALRRWLPGFLAAAPSPKPLLVVQGDNDGTVDWRYNLPQIRRQFPASEVYMLKGGRHHLANESAALRGEFLAVVGGYLDARETAPPPHR